MNLLEIVLLAICLLYAVVLHRALTNIEINDRKVEMIYRELIDCIVDLQKRHNYLVDRQKELPDILLTEVNKELESANNKHLEHYKSFLSELECVKKFISQGFLKR